MTQQIRTRLLDRDDLYRLKVVGDVAITPDGSRIAYTVRQADQSIDGYKSNIYIWSGTDTRQFTRGGKDSAPRWSPDGSMLAFLSARSGEPQLYLLRSSGGEAVQITHLQKGAGEPVWSPDSRMIAFVAPTSYPTDSSEQPESGDTKSELSRVINRAMFKFDGRGFIYSTRQHIFVLDVESRDCRQITEGDFNESSVCWAPDGRRLAFASNRRPNWDTERGTDIWTVPATGGTPLRFTHSPGQWEEPAFSPDGRALAYVGYPLPENEPATYYDQIWLTDAEGETKNLLDGCDLDVGRSLVSDWGAFSGRTLTWDAHGISFVSSSRGKTNIYRIRNGDVSPVTEGAHDITSFAIAENGYICYSKADFSHPAEIFLDRGSGEEQISHENDPLLAEVELHVPQRVVATSNDGQEVEGWLLKPSEFEPSQTYPLLLYIHGGPESAYGHTFFHELQWWTAQGFGVAFCNPRGSTSYGRAFKEAIRGDWGNLDFQDIVAFHDQVASTPWVDRNRMVAAGGSYGGFMINWLAGHTDRFAALCTQRSICNMVSQGGTSDLAPFREERLGGTPERTPERLWDQSPLKFVSNVKTPMLILHQEQDHRCPIEQGEQWFSALKRLGVRVRFIRFPEESHGLSRAGKPSRRFARLGYMADWFRTFV